MMRFLAPLVLLLVAAPALADDAKDALAKANAALKKREFANAAKYADEAIKADPKSAEAYYVRGSAHLSDGKFDKAVADFTRTIELDPKAAIAYDQRGTAHFKMAKIKASLADFDKYIELLPGAAAAHWRRGLTLYYADEFEKGVAQFTTSDKAEPEDVENAVWHYLCNAKVKGVEKARTDLLKVNKDPRGPYFMKIYEMFHGRAKPEDVLSEADAGKATDELRKEQRFYANYYVAMYYECVGEPKKSLQYMKTAVEKYPIGHYMMDVARVHIKLR